MDLEFRAPTLEPPFVPQTPPDLDEGFWASLSSVFIVFILLVMLCLWCKWTHTIPSPPGVGPVADLELQQSVGVDQELKLRHNMPQFVYSSASTSTAMLHGEEICVFCQEKLLDGDFMSMIPPCSHVFHTSCISRYMDVATICPSCRSTIAPGSTPDPITTTSTSL